MPPKVTLNISVSECDILATLAGTHVLLTVHRVAIEAFRRGLRQYEADPTLLGSDLERRG